MPPGDQWIYGNNPKAAFSLSSLIRTLFIISRMCVHACVFILLGDRMYEEGWGLGGGGHPAMNDCPAIVCTKGRAPAWRDSATP
jgi:hypothetical protein